MSERFFRQTDQELEVHEQGPGRGTKTVVSIPLLELADGTWVNANVVVIRGAEPGPVFLAAAAVHGDEINGIHIVQRFARQLDPAGLRGTVLALPVQNPLGLQAQHRFPVGQLLKSPLDQSPADLWAAFPGDPEGNSTQVMAHILDRELFCKADYLIDIHTPTTGGRYLSIAFLPPARVGEPAERAEELAGAFGTRVVLKTDSGMYVHEATPHVVAAGRGAAGFGVELGEGGRVEPELIELGVSGLENMARLIGMLPGSVEATPEQIKLRTMIPVRARRGGLLQCSVGLGELVAAAQVIGTITNPLGQVTEELRAPLDGLLVRATTFPTVMTGERVAQIGIPR
jgi:predicted deacylase